MNAWPVRAGRQRCVVDYSQLGPEPEVGKPDGLCMDTKDNVWVASYGGGTVTCFDTTTGQQLRKVNFPGAKQITSCCFGGADYSDLYVTSSRSRLSEVQLKGQPLAGSLFRVSGLGVKGTAPAVYEG